MFVRQRFVRGVGVVATIGSALTALPAHAIAQSRRGAVSNTDDVDRDDEDNVVSLSEPEHGPRIVRFELGVRGGLAGSFSGFDVGPLAGLEFAVRRTLGPIDGVIQLRATYESHTVSGSGDASCRSIPPASPCVNPDIGRYDYTLLERELQGSLAIGYRIRRLHARWTPYGMLSMAIVRQRLESTVYAITQVESRHSYALGAAIGVQYEFHFVAPFVEAEFRYEPIAAAQTGASLVSTVHLAAGLRFVL